MIIRQISLLLVREEGASKIFQGLPPALYRHIGKCLLKSVGGGCECQYAAHFRKIIQFTIDD